jgi:glucokinase
VLQLSIGNPLADRRNLYRVRMKKEPISVGRPSLLRHTNALALLELLRQVGSCSRADLVRASGMSAPTVTNVVGDLLAANLIQPLGEGESSGGRPPAMIRFNAERGCILGVQITSGYLAFLLTHLGGEELDSTRISLTGKKTDPASICGLIDGETRRLLRKHKMSRKQLLVLVVAVPAIANVDEGIVLSVSTLKNWRSVPLRAMLRKTFKCRVILENDTNLSALGERYCGAAQSEQTFLLINIGANVSAGIVLDGKLHRGAGWSAGEIAYLRLPNVVRKQPALYEFGELESVLTSSAILRSWNEAHQNQVDSSAAPAINAVDVLNLSQAANPRARKIVQHRSRVVADIIVNCSLILNPGLILLGGEIGSHPAMLGFVRKELERCEFAVTRIAAAALAENAALWGAIAVALEAIPSLLLPQPQS